VNGKPVKIITPLINLSKAEIIKLACETMPPSFDHNLLQGGEKACGVCDSCVLRLKGFKEAGIVDTIELYGENLKI